MKYLSQIIALTGLSKNTVLKGIGELESLDLIIVVRKGKGRKSTNVYELNFKSLKELEEAIVYSSSDEPIVNIDKINGSCREPINGVNGAPDEPIKPINGSCREHTKEININKEYKEKDIEPVGSSAFNEIDKIFITGSTELNGQQYYRNAKEAKHIKLLESRYKQNPEEFIFLTRKYYYMISKIEDSFWHGQPFTPSAFNAHYNRVQSYQLPEASRKREEQKNKSEADILLSNYGHFNRNELQFLMNNKTISKEQFEIIMKYKPLEVTA